MTEENDKAGRAGALIEELLGGRTPEAETEEERAWMETAHLLRTQGPPLDPARIETIVDDALRSARPRHVMPWLVAGGAIAAAAAVCLWVWSRPAPELPSRSADALIGRIAPEEAANATRRIDLLFADRLSGYRQGRVMR